MKKVCVLLIAVFAAGAVKGQAWTRKADFGGGNRSGAVGFAIGNKIYVGMGIDISIFKKDFWEYDPTTDTWTQKADFGGTARNGAVGFSVGTSGYIGTGLDSSGIKKDFWEYNPLLNNWIKKADFGGNPRINAVGFSINNKGYLGTGSDLYGIAFYKDFWEYNVTNDLWISKSDFGGIERSMAVGFSINAKGYIGTGYFYDGNTYYYKDFWEYDTATNIWIQKVDFGGEPRGGAAGFSITNTGYGYIGMGLGTSKYKDFWAYNPINNSWIQKSIFPSTWRKEIISISNNDKAYIGFGWQYTSPNVYFYKDFWEYDPSLDNIEEIADRNDLKISPNPANTDLSVELGVNSKSGLCRVLDVLGEEVMKKTFQGNKFSLNVSKLPKGLYLLKIESEEGGAVVRFVKE